MLHIRNLHTVTNNITPAAFRAALFSPLHKPIVNNFAPLAQTSRLCVAKQKIKKRIMSRRYKFYNLGGIRFSVCVSFASKRFAVQHTDGTSARATALTFS